MGALLAAVIFILSLVFASAILIAWGQAYGTLPGQRKTERAAIDWEVPFEMLLVIFMTAPVSVLIYATLVAMSEVQILVDAGMVVFALLIAGIGMDNFHTCCRYFASERWPTTRGRLFRSRHIFWETNMEYRYEVSGRRLLGDRIDAHNTLKAPRYIAYDPYENAVVTVHYHPANPEIALLEPGVNWSSVSVTLSLAINLVAVPLFFWLV